MIVDLIVYTFLTSPKVGGFWGAIICIIGGILAAFSVNRSVAVQRVCLLP